jgi:hypothetical protein
MFLVINKLIAKEHSNTLYKKPQNTYHVGPAHLFLLLGQTPHHLDQQRENRSLRGIIKA